MAKPTHDQVCELCQRQLKLTFHHLIPRKVHRRAHFKKNYTAADLQAGVWLCYPCHKAVHKFHDEMTLAQKLNSLETLLADEEIQKHIAWAKKQRSA